MGPRIGAQVNAQKRYRPENDYGYETDQQSVFRNHGGFGVRPKTTCQDAVY